MLTTFAHRALLAVEPGGDERAPGGAVTLALCGSWEHDGPCPLAPHHTAASPGPDGLEVRVLFACAPSDEEDVRARVVAALASGGCTGPDGVHTGWRLLSEGADAVRPEEQDHATRLASNP